MGRFTRVIALLAAALACAPALAHAAAKAGSTGVPLQIAWRPSSNYTPADRPTSMIRMIVIHVTDGSYFGSIQWLDNPRAQASANYIVSRQGQITQLVRDTDIAWHAGNWAINRESIGVEHEGYTGNPAGFPDVEYRASARLVGWLCRKYLLPIDRSRIIGHSEVPDPNHPGEFGGADHHTDPGRYWDWGRYMGYVRAYARGGAPPRFATPTQATAPTTIRVTRPARRPGKPGARPTLGPIFAFAGLEPGKGLTGFVPWRADVSGAGVSRVEFLVDGLLRWTATRLPFAYGGPGGALDTTQLPNGSHVLAIRVLSSGGRISGSSVRVGVVNTPFSVAPSAPANGQTVSGRVRLLAAVAGGRADHVDFVIDGRLDHTEHAAPYEDAWDTTKLANGAHTLTQRAVAADGRVATSSVTVVVANAAPQPPAPAPASISIRRTSIGDGQTLSGAVRWWADVRGSSLDRVEFWIDGVRQWTERGAPYVYDGDDGVWDTTTLPNGRHVLTVRAFATGGAEADATSVVTVWNRPVAPPLAVSLPLAQGQVVSGQLQVVASVQGQPDRVEFWVDGSLQRVERSAPYEFDWDTTRVPAGTHQLLVRAVDGDTTATAADALTVQAPAPPPLAVSLPLQDGQRLAGSVQVVASVTGTPSRVEFWVDGVLRHVEYDAPYDFQWDTAALQDGTHVLLVRAVAGDRTATATATVATANVAAALAPPPTVSVPLQDGQRLSGSVHVVATVTGPTPSRVEFWVDGTRRHVEYDAPYEFQWDTTQLPDGAHVLFVRDVAGDQTATTSVTVTTANAAAEPVTTTTTPTTSTTTTPTTTSTPTTTTTTPTTTAPVAPAPQPLAVSTGLADGQTVSGVVEVVAAVTGTVRRVDFYVDGRRWHSAWSAPYGFEWNTGWLRDGTHVLLVVARGADGSVAQASASVNVSNSAG